MVSLRSTILPSVFVTSLVLVVACAVRTLEVTPMDAATAETVTVRSPVKVHLHDGSTVVFADGVTIAQGFVRGEGRKYDLALDSDAPVSSIPLEDVAAMESYQTPLRPGQSVAATAFATPFALVGGGILAIALFGSCPTTYALSDGQPVLEAESFSYSIAPGFEARDVDRLNVPAGSLESVELIIRNEALETHYINHVELLETVHEPGRRVVPDPEGRLMEIGMATAPVRAEDRQHRAVVDALASYDGRFWHSDATQLHSASLEDFRDYLDLQFDAPRHAERLALVFRLRNTLLNTVLFYDVMLKGQGFKALDWMGHDLNRFIDRARLGLWYRDRMGMRISVWENGRYREVARVSDQGPIAWKDVAVDLPRPVDNEPLRVRLSFVVDNWQIDWVALSADVRQPRLRPVAPARIESERSGPIPGALENVSHADERYLVTHPGDALQVAFDVGPVPAGRSRTFLLAAQGYYIEWMRGAWLSESPNRDFKPTDEALLRAIRQWEGKRDSFQEQFESSRISMQ